MRIMGLANSITTLVGGISETEIETLLVVSARKDGNVAGRPRSPRASRDFNRDIARRERTERWKSKEGGRPMG